MLMVILCWWLCLFIWRWFVYRLFDMFGSLIVDRCWRVWDMMWWERLSLTLSGISGIGFRKCVGIGVDNGCIETFINYKI